MGSLIDSVVSWAKAQVGNGYVWGATGWVCSLARREQQAKQYPAQAGNILGVRAKWDGKPCYDCAQFVKAALKLLGLSLVSGATSQYKQTGVWEESGAIASIPQGVLAVIWRASDAAATSFAHVGLRLPDGTVVEAKDSASGITQTAQLSSKWTHYKIPVGARSAGNGGAIMEAIGTGIVATQSGTLNLRAEANTDAIVFEKIPKGGTVELLSGIENGWYQARYNGVIGYVSAEYIAPQAGSSGGSDMVSVPRTLLAQLAAYLGNN